VAVTRSEENTEVKRVVSSGTATQWKDTGRPPRRSNEHQDDIVYDSLRGLNSLRTGCWRPLLDYIFRHSAAKLRARRWRDSRGSVAIPGPQQPGCDDYLLAAVRRARGPWLGQSGGGYWSLASVESDCVDFLASASWLVAVILWIMGRSTEGVHTSAASSVACRKSSWCSLTKPRV
jgi:hypothetical protein